MPREIHHGGCTHFPDGICVISEGGDPSHLSDEELASMSDEEASEYFTSLIGSSVTIENASDPSIRIVRTP